MDIIFLDSEFTVLDKDAAFISLALYFKDDCYFYAELNDVDYNNLSDWIKENILIHLEFLDTISALQEEGRTIRMKGNSKEVKTALQIWLLQFEQIEIWADVLAFDWVLFCNFFNGAFGIPKNIFYIPFDLATLFKILQYNPDLSRFDFVAHLLKDDEKLLRHHALTDAKVGRLCLRKLSNL